jgi:hypothetical protein
MLERLRRSLELAYDQTLLMNDIVVKRDRPIWGCCTTPLQASSSRSTYSPPCSMLPSKWKHFALLSDFYVFVVKRLELVHLPDRL